MVFHIFIGLKVAHRFVSASVGGSEVDEDVGWVIECSVSGSRNQGLTQSDLSALAGTGFPVSE